MLINFNFSNSRSFYEATSLSMQATKDEELKQINTFTIDENLMPKGENTLLKSAIIFGGNASGKSNIFKALAYMKNVILLSASQFPVVQSNQVYAFYENTVKEDSLYEVEFIQNNTYYKYGFILNNHIVKKEWLERRKERLTTIFKRSENRLEIIGPDKAAAKLINLAPTALFLSVGKNFHLDIAKYLNDVMLWFQNLLIVFENNANSLDIYTMANGKYKEQALKILALADIGIKNIDVVKDKIVNMADLNDVLRFNTELQIQPKPLGQLKQEENNIFNIDMRTFFDVYDSKSKKTISKKEIMLLKDVGFN